MMNSVEFFLREAWLNVRRSGLTGVTATTTVLVSLCILGSFGLLVMNVDQMARTEAKRLDVRVFLKGDVTAQYRRQMHQQLLKTKNVVGAEFISREAALKLVEADFKSLDLSYLQKHKRRPPFPESFCIRVSPMSAIPGLVQQWSALRGVDEVTYEDEAWRKLTAASRALKALMLTGGGLLTLGVLVIISNTIRLTIYARRRDIRVMQLVGATMWFIRIPFMLEGVFYGVLGAVAACVLLAPLYSYLLTFVRSTFGAAYAPLLVTNFGVLFRLHASVLLIGMIFGLTGSYLSMRRFVRYA